jgi:hypothetical protein
MTLDAVCHIDAEEPRMAWRFSLCLGVWAVKPVKFIEPL